ncbi:MAG: hypothetical protein HN712_19760 [Gemmatimonadetes bacterium]|nr:hypothetical protein [Gemmatimonadota bacterium]MBT7862560.1 hypothetical protein [Gemmatimonadota bacterium]
MEVRLYDAAGQRIRTLVQEPLQAGRYIARWDGLDDAGRPTATGVYFARLIVDGRQRLTRKMLMLR